MVILFRLHILHPWGFDPKPNGGCAQESHREGFAKGTVHRIVQTPDGYLRVATEAGLLGFDGVRAVPWQPPQGEHLPSNVIRSVGRDSIWHALQGTEGHYGLPGMRERATLIGGKLTVWSEVEAGTEIELRVPATTAYTADRRASWWSRKLAGKAKA